jgi:hypothetical protein
MLNKCCMEAGVKGYKLEAARQLARLYPEPAFFIHSFIHKDGKRNVISTAPDVLQMVENSDNGYFVFAPGERDE